MKGLESECEAWLFKRSGREDHTDVDRRRETHANCPSFDSFEDLFNSVASTDLVGGQERNLGKSQGSQQSPT